MTSSSDQLSLHRLNVRSASQRAAFLSFYYQLMQAEEKWVAPLRILQGQIINPRKNPFLQKVAHHFFLVKNGSQCVGRFALFGPGLWPDQPHTGSFGFVDFIKDYAPQVLRLLQQQAKNLGMRQVVGPLNPNIHYDVGVMARGFDQHNYVMMNHNPAHYARCFEKAGFEVLQRFNTWSLWKENFVPDRQFQQAQQRVQRNKSLVLREANLGNFSRELKLFHRLYNESFQTHWGFQPIAFDEFRFIASDLKYLLKPKMALIAEIDGQPAGFVLSIPNLNELLLDNRKGRLSPEVLYRLLFGRKSISTVRVMIAGVLPEHRFRGVHVALFHQIAKNIFELGYEGGEIAWVMEGNRPVEHSLSRMGAKVEKQYLMYSLKLADPA